jgi:putative serine protease PepD
MSDHRRGRSNSGRLWTDGRETDEHLAWVRPKPRPREEPAPPPPPKPPRRRGRIAAFIATAAVAVLAIGLSAGFLLNGNDGSSGQTSTIKVDSSPAPADGRNATIRDVYAKASPSVVSVRVRKSGGQGSGTGWVIDQTGNIVTNAHVVDGATDIRVQLDDHGEEIPVQLVGVDKSSDLAVLKLPGGQASKVKPLTLAESNDVKVGDLAIAIGYPLGLDRTATSGIVSGVGREIQAPNGYTIDKVIQTDAPINPGNSGGPLLDSRGRVIGVNSQIATAGSAGNVGIGFAVPADTVRDIVPKLLSGKTIARPYLGVSTGEPLNGAAGAEVGDVNPSSPADAAGIRNGDIIRQVAGKAVGGPSDVAAAIEGKKPGDKVTVEVLRGGSVEQFEVTLGTRPDKTP